MSSRRMMSVLDISDFNGIQENDDDGLIKELGSVDSFNDEEDNENEQESFKDVIEDKFEQILEHKNLDKNWNLVERNTLNVESPTSFRLGKSVTSKNYKGITKNQNKLTRSTMFLQTIIEERKERMKKTLKPTQSIKASTKNLEESIPLNFDISISAPDSELIRLKKEYFKITVAIEAMQWSIDQSLFNTEKMWLEAKDKISVENYTSYVIHELKRYQRKGNDVQDVLSTDVTTHSNAFRDGEQYANLANLMMLKI